MANTDDIPYQPVWVTFDPVACGVILRREIESKVDSKIWHLFGTNQGFKEDKWPGMVDRVPTEPTFDWVGMVTGQRRSDETCFYSRVRIPKSAISPRERWNQIWTQGSGDKIELSHLMSIIGNSIEFFNSFSTCECKVGKPCEHHAELGHAGDPHTGESDA